MTSRTRQAWGCATEIGRVRTHNEDSLLAQPPLFVVADGLGGHQAGEIASSIAVETLRDNAPRKADIKALGRAARAANTEVIRAAKEGYGRSGMGTTLTAAIVDGTRVAIAQVGDSRAYLLHAGLLSRLTDDHSMVADLVRSGQITEEEARVHPNRSVITRALGTDPNVYADTYDLATTPGDRLLLCTDGLTGMLEDGEIARILGEYADPTIAAKALVDAACEAGGYDNVTVIVVDIEAAPRGRAAGDTAATGKGWVGALIWLLVIAMVVGAALFGGYRYAQSRAFLIAENGRVVIYRGVPGSIGGLSLKWYESPDPGIGPVDLANLPLATQAELKAGIAEPSVAAAYALARRLRDQATPSYVPSTTPTSAPPATSTPTP